MNEGNSVVKLSQFGEVTNEFLPLDNNAKAALIKKDLLYVSDWSHTVKYYINDSGVKSVALSVKGNITFQFYFIQFKKKKLYIKNTFL